MLVLIACTFDEDGCHPGTGTSQIGTFQMSLGKLPSDKEELGWIEQEIQKNPSKYNLRGTPNCGVKNVRILSFSPFESPTR